MAGPDVLTVDDVEVGGDAGVVPRGRAVRSAAELRDRESELPSERHHAAEHPNVEGDRSPGSILVRAAMRRPTGGGIDDVLARVRLIGDARSMHRREADAGIRQDLLSQ